MKKSKIIAVVVTFNPNISDLRANLVEVLNQVDSVILVDNSAKHK